MLIGTVCVQIERWRLLIWALSGCLPKLTGQKRKNAKCELILGSWLSVAIFAVIKWNLQTWCTLWSVLSQHNTLEAVNVLPFLYIFSGIFMKWSSVIWMKEYLQLLTSFLCVEFFCSGSWPYIFHFADRLWKLTPCILFATGHEKYMFSLFAVKCLVAFNMSFKPSCYSMWWYFTFDNLHFSILKEWNTPYPYFDEVTYVIRTSCLFS